MTHLRSIEASHAIRLLQLSLLFMGVAASGGTFQAMDTAVVPAGAQSPAMAAGSQAQSSVPASWPKCYGTAAYFLSTLAYRDKGRDICSEAGASANGDLADMRPMPDFSAEDLDQHPRFLTDVDKSGEMDIFFGSNVWRGSGGNCAGCEWLTTFIFWSLDGISVAYIELGGDWEWRLEGSDIVAVERGEGAVTKRYAFDREQGQYAITKASTSPLPASAAAASAAWSVPIELTPSMVPPELLTRVDPDVPIMARRLGKQGDVVLQCVIDQAGKVSVDRVLVPVEMVTDAAVAAVRLWRYKPALRDGRPQAVYLTVRVHVGP